MGDIVARWRSRTAAFELLARLCANGNPGARIAAAPTSHEIDLCDWSEFARLIARHRVAGVVHGAIGSVPGVPARICEFLAAEFRDLARQNLAYAAETARLQQRLDEAGIHAVLFKGVALSSRAYGSPVIKHGKDIDFIIGRADVPACIELLERDGYRLWLPRPALTSAQWRSVLRFGMEVAMIHPATGIQIEPHWQLAANPRLLPTERMMRRAGDHGDTAAGKAIRTFHPHDLFAYLCVHGATSGWFRLKWLADLNALLGNAPPAEIERLYRHADGLGVGPCAAVALSMCAEVFGREVPDIVAAQAEARWPLRRMRALFLDNLLQPGPFMSVTRHLAGHLLLGASHGYLLSEIRRWMVSPSDSIALPLPQPLHFLYPIMRIPLFLRRMLTRAGKAPFPPVPV